MVRDECRPRRTIKPLKPRGRRHGPRGEHQGPFGQRLSIISGRTCHYGPNPVDGVPVARNPSAGEPVPPRPVSRSPGYLQHPRSQPVGHIQSLLSRWSGSGGIVTLTLPGARLRVAPGSALGARPAGPGRRDAPFLCRYRKPMPRSGPQASAHVDVRVHLDQVVRSRLVPGSSRATGTPVGAAATDIILVIRPSPASFRIASWIA
jgi:hypothetical protein